MCQRGVHSQPVLRWRRSPGWAAYFTEPCSLKTLGYSLLVCITFVSSLAVAQSPPLAISPQSALVRTGSGLNLTASGGSETGYTFRLVSNLSGGSANTSGIYLAGSTGNVTDVMEASDSAGNLARVHIDVVPASTGPKVSPYASTMVTGKSLSVVVMSGTATPPYTWSWAAHNSAGSTFSPATGATTVYTAGAPSSASDNLKLTDGTSAVAFSTISVIAAPLSVSPMQATLPPRGSKSFSPSGGSGLGYQWSVSPNASGGSVNSLGAYVAGPNGGVTDVVQVMDSLGIVAVAPIVVTAAVAIAPGSATVAPRGSQVFAARGGSGSGYVWSLSSSQSGGTITPAGVYTAGPTGNVSDVVHVVDSLANFALATVTVTGGISITPNTGTVPPKGSLNFAASGGGGTGFTWDLLTNSSGGDISPQGVYTAGTHGGVSDVVRATDSLNSSATVTVAVTASLSVSPPSATLQPRNSQVFTASGGSGTGYTWTFVTNASGGNLGPETGIYMAGSVGGTTDVVGVADSLGNTAAATVIVANPGASHGCGGSSVTGGGAMPWLIFGLLPWLATRRRGRIGG